MKLFDLNGPLMSALGKLADIVICNMMFCIFSLPIVTAGASLAALFACMQQLISDDAQDDGLIFRVFWRAFKQNFKQATLLWLLCLLAFGFLGVYYALVFSLEGILGRVYRVSFFVLCLVFLFGFQYLFPLQARYQNKLRHTIKNAWLLSVAAFPWTVLSLLVVGLGVYLSFFLSPNGFTMAVYLWAICGFGVLAYLNSFFFRRAFRKITPEAEQQASHQAEGALFTDEDHRRGDLLIQESSFSNPYWNQRDISPSKQPEKKGRKKR
jgi:uncharacterized membrane protein YesL